MYRDAAGLIAVSAPLRRAALAVAPAADIRVIPNGVDAERFRPAENRDAADRNAQSPLRGQAAGIQGRAGRDPGLARHRENAGPPRPADRGRRRSVAARARNAGRPDSRRRVGLGGAVPRLARAGGPAVRLRLGHGPAAAVLRGRPLERDPGSAGVGAAVRGFRRAGNPGDGDERARGDPRPAAGPRTRSRARWRTYCRARTPAAR